MTRAQLLTSDQVARLVGINRDHVRSWADLRGISHVQLPGERRYLYPAAAVRAAHYRETTLPAQLRLRRWVARALIA